VVRVIARLSIRDRTRYDRCTAGFMEVLRQLGGRLLVRGIECMSDMHSIGRDARVVIMTAAALRGSALYICEQL
jgi:uncharacterized protein (DUF1330 family)